MKDASIACCVERLPSLTFCRSFVCRKAAAVGVVYIRFGFLLVTIRRFCIRAEWTQQ